MAPFCALSTPSGVSGIAVIRASGEAVSQIVSGALRIIRASGNRTGINLTELGGYESCYAQFIDPDTRRDIDNVVVTVFKAPHSYTGEDMIEISCHGGSAVRQEILCVLNKLGIRPAGPGEFTKTAFINGKLDLSQAEAVMNVISADSKRSLDAANSQLMGALKSRIISTEDELYKALSLIEMMLEFPEHDDTPENTLAVRNMISKSSQELSALSDSYARGRMLTERMKVAILGLPNSGKSTLLNYLAGFDRAIVTDTPGTTRDTLEFNTDIEGIPVTFVDTAGIRETGDEIEAIGVKLAGIAASEADLVLYLIAPTATLEEVQETVNGLNCSKMDVIFTKSDLGSNALEAQIKEYLEGLGVKHFAQVSIKENANTEAITRFVVDAYENAASTNAGDITILNSRHSSLLGQATSKLKSSMDILDGCLGIDVASQVIRGALDDLGEITGRVVSDELVDTIFSKFCIGK
ncbi:MAG: tRNA uridine-5-carboxymethylaminomethyl(34) synthesis GTPase MnmE [Saccharofermentans sp.]|nr:tRNA uridine-5-carboxymethylaminomethyl(34) synthesis GTPase MnmE [Saccharofermentans sp.]